MRRINFWKRVSSRVLLWATATLPLVDLGEICIFCGVPRGARLSHSEIGGHSIPLLVERWAENRGDLISATAGAGSIESCSRSASNSSDLSTTTGGGRLRIVSTKSKVLEYGCYLFVLVGAHGLCDVMKSSSRLVAKEFPRPSPS